ncbi:unnamed protein product [Musa acuminata subsp. malaccensis]|uniref:(wild Malaysian banana) hypothetical protein n=1 Tax=Musa acuminata subsp. malaccensis TaxID=214687 RepID=A0A804K023_MUSAM|nr:unnamed protein product [Musa acuminata subsp. malaccensis]
MTAIAFEDNEPFVFSSRLKPHSNLLRLLSSPPLRPPPPDQEAAVADPIALILPERWQSLGWIPTSIRRLCLP